MIRMRNLLAFIALLAALLLAAGCEKGGEIKIYNRTSYPVYVGALSENYTIPADSMLTLEVSTASTSIFNPDVGKYVDLIIKGETYQIWDAFLNAYVDTTSVWVDAGKTSRVYLDPNRASVKVVNQTSQWIKKIIVHRGTLSGTTTSTFDVFMGPGESWQKPQAPADATHNYWYIVQIQFENDDLLSYGDSNNVLNVDEQFLVNVIPIDTK